MVETTAQLCPYFTYSKGRNDGEEDREATDSRGGEIAISRAAPAGLSDDRRLGFGIRMGRVRDRRAGPPLRPGTRRGRYGVGGRGAIRVARRGPPGDGGGPRRVH